MSSKTSPRRTTRKAHDRGNPHIGIAGVVGLGYVGLPLMVECARAGIQAVGFDTDPARRRMIRRGESPVEDIASEDLRPLVKSGIVSVAEDWSALRDVDAISICVPTPLRKSKEPDISFVTAAAESLKPHLRRGHLIILESTTYPGTTREIVLPILESTGLRVGKDFWLAFSPERVDPGNVEWPLSRIPKVIGGITPECTREAAAFYSRIFETVHPVSSAEAAEMAKLLENTFRAVNIGLVNEFALTCDRLGLDTWEVIKAAGTKPFGFMSFKPGPGLGGHCIPIDPQYLSWRMRLLNFTTRFIDLAEEVNSEMPRHAVLKMAMALNHQGKAISKTRVLVVGVAYKADVSDIRESPALDIIELLISHGAKLRYHDPLVPTLTVGEHTLKSSPLTAKTLRSFDAVMIVTPHTGIDHRLIIRSVPLVFDCRGVTAGMKGKNIFRL
ncbi:nucleotide sugar dehydrogenase [Candidatus Sumerlaeota bacterium]|nr:nucleotide sugar dehydrogenase [Candidatus Sumerlaeota bacterium]